MKFIGILTAFLLSVGGISFVTAAPALAENCARSSVVMKANHGHYRARVYYRDCNSWLRHWYEVSGIRGTVALDRSDCTRTFGRLDHIKETFHLNDRNGVSHTFYIYVPCGDGHTTRYHNIDRWMGRTYESHSAVGVHIHQVVVKGPDTTWWRGTRLH